VQNRCDVDRYPALIGTGLLERLGAHAHKYLHRDTCVVISDSNVAPLFAPRVKKSLTSAGFRLTVIMITAGEK
jgi:3-dehydroquinate synthase